VGLYEPDDAAVLRLDAERALVSTVDFFPPVVDDAYDFGAIAAANALSDVYAMGGQPLLAVNLVAFPDALDKAILAQILRGGAEKVKEAGAFLAGGHSIDDDEPKYGLAVTGLVHPQQIIHKSGAVPGDVLILSKALGTGLVTTALKRGEVNSSDLQAAVRSMSHLNGNAAQLAQAHHCHAMTDITGYGFVGHALEMARLSCVDFLIDFAALQWLPGVEAYARAGHFPGGMQRNRDYYAQWVDGDEKLPAWARGLLYDPQTSGGLLMALPAAHAQSMLDALQSAGEMAARVGTVRAGAGRLQLSAS